MAAKKKVATKAKKKPVATPLPEPKVEEQKGMAGFCGSKAVEDFIRNRIGFLAEGCSFDYMPFYEDIKAGRSQFARYDIICKHKDGETILHYKVNFDSSGRFVPDPVVDNTVALRLMKG
jgi:hypothetical protein